MKKIFGYITALAAIPAALVSCAQDNLHEPGEPDLDGCYGVYFPTQETDLVLDPTADAKTATITARRVNTEGTIDVPFEVTDPAGIFTVSGLHFEDGQTESQITLDFSKAEIGVTYTCSFLISDPQYASYYNSNPVALDFSVLFERWNDLGEARWIVGANDYFNPFEETVHIYQNDNNENEFRIPMKWDTADGQYAVYTEDSDEYFYFTLLQPGNVVGDVTITMDNLVDFELFNTGYINPNYPGDPLYMVHPGSFSGKTESNFTNNSIMQYQEDGLPGVISIAPFYYLMGAGGGWDMSGNTDVVTIVFPGVTLVDYSLSILSGESDNGLLPVQFVLGTDVASAKYQIYEGTLSSAAIDDNAAAIGNGTEEANDVPEGGIFSVSMNATGVYTIVGVTFDESGAAQESSSAVLHYVAAGDEMPVVVSAGITATGKYGSQGYTSDHTLEYYIYGTDISSAKILLLTTTSFESDAQGALQNLLAQDDLEADVLEEINNGGTVGVYINRKPGTEYTFLVYASNSYESTVISATATTTGVLDVDLVDMLGTYNVNAISYFSGPLTEQWVIEASDDMDKGNIMLTSIAGLSGTAYGTFDSESGTLSFADGQNFGQTSSGGNTVDLYFMNAEAYAPISFDIIDDGMFSDPSNMFGLSVNEERTSWYDIYTYVSARKTSDAGTTAASATGRRFQVRNYGKGSGGHAAAALPAPEFSRPREVTAATFTATATPGAAPVKATKAKEQTVTDFRTIMQ